MIGSKRVLRRPTDGLQGCIQVACTSGRPIGPHAMHHCGACSKPLSLLFLYDAKAPGCGPQGSKYGKRAPHSSKSPKGHVCCWVASLAKCTSNFDWTGLYIGSTSAVRPSFPMQLNFDVRLARKTSCRVQLLYSAPPPHNV